MLPSPGASVTGCRTLVTRPAAVVNGSVGRPLSRATAGRTVYVKGRVMSDSDDFAAMNDPDFLAEYDRVRDALQALTNRMSKMTEEFDRRARAKWASASQG